MHEFMRDKGLLSKETRAYGEGLLFPATKDQIVSHAREKHLPKEVIEKIEKLPDKTYDNIGEMISSAMAGTD